MKNISKLDKLVITFIFVHNKEVKDFSDIIGKFENRTKLFNRRLNNLWVTEEFEGFGITREKIRQSVINQDLEMMVSNMDLDSLFGWIIKAHSHRVLFLENKINEKHLNVNMKEPK